MIRSGTPLATVETIAHHRLIGSGEKRHDQGNGVTQRDLPQPPMCGTVGVVVPAQIRANLPFHDPRVRNASNSATDPGRLANGPNGEER